MDASQYKDYVLMILFVKYLSDKARQRQMELDVPDGCYFEDFVALKQNPHIGEKINEKLEAIREANTAFIGGLTLPNFNDDTKLGSGKTKVETLSKLCCSITIDSMFQVQITPSVRYFDLTGSVTSSSAHWKQISEVTDYS